MSSFDTRNDCCLAQGVSFVNGTHLRVADRLERTHEYFSIEKHGLEKASTLALNYKKKEDKKAQHKFESGVIGVTFEAWGRTSKVREWHL